VSVMCRLVIRRRRGKHGSDLYLVVAAWLAIHCLPSYDTTTSLSSQTDNPPNQPTMDRSLLARATDGSEAPTPGYLYVDLAKGAAANPSVCLDMVKYLINRLTSKQNVYVKTKACKVLGKLCEQVPRNQFRRAVSQDPTAVAAIKAAIAWRGPMDPLQGDAKNEAVRKAARECLDAVYAEQPEGAGNAGGGGANAYGGYGGVSSSYGGAPHANGGGPGGPSARRMEGIGNPMFGDPRMAQAGGAPGGNGQQKIQAAVKEASEVVMGMIRDPLARHVGAGGAQQQQAPAQGHSGDLPGYNRGVRDNGGWWLVGCGCGCWWSCRARETVWSATVCRLVPTKETHSHPRTFPPFSFSRESF
jgi:hypothetical protein